MTTTTRHPAARAGRRRPHLVGRVRGPRLGPPARARPRPGQMREVGLAATEFGPDGFLPDAPEAKAATLAATGCAPSASSCPVVLHDAAFDPLPAVVDGHGGARRRAGLHGRHRRRDRRRGLRRPPGARRRPVGDAAAQPRPDLGRRGRPRPARDAPPPRRHHGRERARRPTGCSPAAASRSASTPATCSSAAATRSGSPSSTPSGSATCTSRTSASTSPRGVQAGRAHLHRRRRPTGCTCRSAPGDVDIAAIVAALEGSGYAGWYVLEQDTILTGAPGRDRGRPGGRRARLASTHILAVARSLEPGAPGRHDAWVRGRATTSSRWAAPASTSTPSSTASGWRRSAPSRSSSAAAPPTSRSPRPATATPSRLVTKVGDDPFGRYVRREAPGSAWTRHPSRPRRRRTAHARGLLRGVPPRRLPAVLLPLPGSTRPPARGPTTCPLDAIRDARVFWATVTGLSQEPSRATHHAAWAARGRTRPHGARPGLPADVLGRPRRGLRTGGQGPRARDRRGRQPRGVRGRGRRDRPPPRRRRPARPRASTSPSSSRGPEGVLAATRDERVEVGTLPGRGRQRPRRRRRLRRCARPRPARRVGPATAPSSSPTSPGRSSPAGSSARPPCRRPTRSRPPSQRGSHDDRRAARRVDTAALTEIRATRPRAHRARVGRARRCARSCADDGRLLLVAADHPARGALGVRADAMAMASRTDLLDAAGHRPRAARASTACSARPTSSTTSSSSAPSRARSSSAR